MLFGRQKLSEREVLDQAAAFAGHPTLQTLTGPTLKELTQRFGIDFATALLFDRFQKSPRHGKFIERIDALRSNPSRRSLEINARLVIVPGALYVERPEMGGDGRLVREVAHAFGLKTDLIPLVSLGSVVRNAQLIRSWFEKHLDERIILVSLSKGGADLKMALAAPEAASLFRNVIAWVNVCGPLNGSRMANWILASRVRTWFFRCKFRWQKRDFQFITDMQYGPVGPLNRPLYLPSSMRMISPIGFPLRQHMTSRLSRSCHRTLARWGPTDGTTSLSDLLEWPGEIYPAWAMDHYFRPEDKARQLIAAVLCDLG